RNVPSELLDLDHPATYTIPVVPRYTCESPPIGPSPQRKPPSPASCSRYHHEMRSRPSPGIPASSDPPSIFQTFLTNDPIPKITTPPRRQHRITAELHPSILSPLPHCQPRNYFFLVTSILYHRVMTNQ